MKTKRCAGPCGRELPTTAFQMRALRGGPFLSKVLGKAMSAVCKECIGAAGAKSRAKRTSARVAAVIASGRVRCCGPLHRGAEVPLSSCRPRKGRALPCECRECERFRIRQYRDQEWFRDRYRENDRARSARAQKRRRARVGTFDRPRTATQVAKKKLQSFLRLAVHRGLVQRPTSCSACPRGAPRYKVAGHFPRGREGDLSAVEWLCYPCLHARTRTITEEPEPEDDGVHRRALAREALRTGRGLLEALRGPVEAVLCYAPPAAPIDARRLAWASGRGTYAEQCLEDALGVGQGTWRPEDHPAAE